MNGQRSRPYFLFILMLICSTLYLVQCSGKKQSPYVHQAQNITVSTRVDSSFKVQYAKGFTVNTHQGYTMINVFNPFQHHADTLRYELVPRNQPLPAVHIDAQLIRTPIQSMIATSTTHIALTEMLHSNNIIKGMVGAQYAYNPQIRRQVEQDNIKSFKKGNLNNEVILNMHPDLVMLSAGQTSQFNRFRLMVKSGIAVFMNAEWLETTPLGKAEWIKVMGLLTGKEKEAIRKFHKVARRYQQLKKKVQAVKSKPLVINNMPYKGAWFVSGGDSFTARYFKDAGADYPWFDNESTGGLHLSFETVFAAGLRADVWLNPGAATTKSDILAKDKRLRKFKSFKNDEIYNNNKRMSPGGGNDFWETGVVRPDLVLHDLITILHPNMMNSDSLYFYQQVK